MRWLHSRIVFSTTALTREDSLSERDAPIPMNHLIRPWVVHSVRSEIEEDLDECEDYDAQSHEVRIALSGYKSGELVQSFPVHRVSEMAYCHFFSYRIEGTVCSVWLHTV